MTPDVERDGEQPATPQPDSADVFRRLEGEPSDMLTSHALDNGVSDVSVAKAIKWLPGSFDPAGEWPEDFRPSCQKCNEEMVGSDEMCTRFGHFYHVDCVPVEEGVTLHEWFGGDLP